MTQTTDAPADRGGAGGAGSGADATVERWLGEFDEAPRAGDAERAAQLFDPEGYWRDFVAFTWNLKT
ncbi:hypothetical protein SJ358_25345, partial [Enterobacter hormaechei]